MPVYCSLDAPNHQPGAAAELGFCRLSRIGGIEWSRTARRCANGRRCCSGFCSQVSPAVQWLEAHHSSPRVLTVSIGRPPPLSPPSPSPAPFHPASLGAIIGISAAPPGLRAWGASWQPFVTGRVFRVYPCWPESGLGSVSVSLS